MHAAVCLSVRVVSLCLYWGIFPAQATRGLLGTTSLLPQTRTKKILSALTALRTCTDSALAVPKTRTLPPKELLNYVTLSLQGTIPPPHREKANHRNIQDAAGRFLWFYHNLPRSCLYTYAQTHTRRFYMSLGLFTFQLQVNGCENNVNMCHFKNNLLCNPD